ncbi:MAG: ABC transporter permease [Armatimonadetes bacterium]|nr:ABC transporter permease [Armatimonadota bacterium]
MKNAIIIMQRELRSYFTSTIAYTVAAFFLFICGYLFFSVLAATQEASLRYMLHNAAVTMLLIAPALTMRLVAEERRSGTIELLMTAPVTDTQVVIGKYLGSLVFFLSMLVLSLQYPIILMRLGSPEMGPMFTGFLGMFLLGAAFLAIGLVASSLTKNQIVAAIGAFAVMLLLWIVQWAAGPTATGWLPEVLRQLSVLGRFDNFVKGVVDTRDLVFFASLIGFCLFLSVRALAAVKAR